MKFKWLIFILPLLTLGNSDCSQAPKLKWDGTIYVGSSFDKAVVGQKDGFTFTIPSDSPHFDLMVCTDQFLELQEAYKNQLAKCQKWAR